MSISDIASVLKSVGSTGFALVLMAFICVTLLTSLIALVRWVLEHMVPLEVHEALRDELCSQMDRIENNQRDLLLTGGRR